MERSERLNREKDGEISSFIIEAPAEEICVDEATTVGAVAVGVDANFRKEDDGVMLIFCRLMIMSLKS